MPCMEITGNRSIFIMVPVSLLSSFQCVMFHDSGSMLPPGPQLSWVILQGQLSWAINRHEVSSRGNRHGLSTCMGYPPGEPFMEYQLPAPWMASRNCRNLPRARWMQSINAVNGPLEALEAHEFSGGILPLPEAGSLPPPARMRTIDTIRTARSPAGSIHSNESLLR